MDIMLEKVAPSVGDDPAVQNVDFSDCPRIEPGFREIIDQDLVVADLDVAGPQPDSSDARTTRQGAEIIVMNDPADCGDTAVAVFRSEEHTSELQSLMRISYAVFCLKKKQQTYHDTAKLSHKE